MKPAIFQSQVLEANYSTPHVKHLKVSVPKGFEFSPGQYASLSVPFQGKKFRSPFSIATFPEKIAAIDFFIRLSKGGRTSAYVESLKENDKIELFGPLGKFVPRESSMKKDIFFISSGTGITAFMSMIPSLLENGYNKKIILFKGFRNEEDILYEKESLELGKKYGNFEFHNILSQPKNKRFKDKGHVQDFFGKYIPQGFEGDFYICGLKEMVNAVRENLISKGFGEERIFFENYD